MTRNKLQDIRNQALEIFKTHGGMLRSSEAIAKGIHPRILYELRDSGIIEQLQRGLFALVDLPDMEEPDLITVSKKVPEGVICLISALYHHRLTVQIPRWIDVAVRQKYSPPSIQNPPVQFHWFSESVFNSGIETNNFGGAKIKIYSPEKSIVDCFRLRKKVGIEIALEALKRYLAQGNTNLSILFELAKESRVTQFIEPFIQAMTYDQS